MNGYALVAVIAICATAILCTGLWAAVRVNQTKEK